MQKSFKVQIINFLKEKAYCTVNEYMDDILD